METVSKQHTDLKFKTITMETIFSIRLECCLATVTMETVSKQHNVYNNKNNKNILPIKTRKIN